MELSNTSANKEDQSLLSWDDLINECQRLEQVARKIQNNDYVGETRPGLSSDKVSEFINDYLSWYGECLSVLPDSLKDKFRLEYEGTESSLKIKSFLEAPLDGNPYYTSEVLSAITSGVGPVPDLWLRPYDTTFRIPLLAQKQILYEARRHKPKLSTSNISYDLHIGPQIYVHNIDSFQKARDVDPKDVIPFLTNGRLAACRRETEARLPKMVY